MTFMWLNFKQFKKSFRLFLFTLFMSKESNKGWKNASPTQEKVL